MPRVDIDLDSRGMRQFQVALQEYLAWNKRDPGRLLESRALRIKWALYREFKAIAPTKEGLTAELRGRGNRIKRRKRRNPKGKAYIKLRNKKTRALFVARRPSPTRLEIEEEIALRAASIKYLSVGFMFRDWRHKEGGQIGTYRAVGNGFQGRRSKTIGQAEVRTSTSLENPMVIIRSYLEGVVVQDRERRLVDKALEAQVADMRTYVTRKQKQAYDRIMAGHAPVPI